MASVAGFHCCWWHLSGAAGSTDRRSDLAVAGIDRCVARANGGQSPHRTSFAQPHPRDHHQLDRDLRPDRIGGTVSDSIAVAQRRTVALAWVRGRATVLLCATAMLSLTVPP